MNLCEQGHLCNFQARRQATATAAAVRPSAAGLFSWLTGEQSSSLPSLDTPLESISFPPSLPDFVESGKVRVKTLENGIRIASEASAVCVDFCNVFMLCIIELIIPTCKLLLVTILMEYSLVN